MGGKHGGADGAGKVGCGGDAAILEEEVTDLPAVGQNAKALNLLERVGAHEVGDDLGHIFRLSHWDADDRQPPAGGRRVTVIKMNA